jgi:signal transduction histidine kinase
MSAATSSAALTALSDGMLAIAGGRLDTPVAVEGTRRDRRDGPRGGDLPPEQLWNANGFEIANKYKSQFLAAASHDLRQPLHALNLFVAQLRTESDPAERERIVTASPPPSAR